MIQEYPNKYIIGEDFIDKIVYIKFEISIFLEIK